MMMSTHAAVAVGLGQLNPDNSGECLDPDTGLSHGLGSPWSVSGCGEAKCDLRQGTVFISYSYCCNVQQDSFMPYPYCCPRSICPATPSLTSSPTASTTSSATSRRRSCRCRRTTG